MALRAQALVAMTVSATCCAERPGDWIGSYSPCDQHAGLLQDAPMSLGVCFESNHVLTGEFTHASDYWA